MQVPLNQTLPLGLRDPQTDLVLAAMSFLGLGSTGLSFLRLKNQTGSVRCSVLLPVSRLYMTCFPRGQPALVYMS